MAGFSHKIAYESAIKENIARQKIKCRQASKPSNNRKSDFKLEHPDQLQEYETKGTFVSLELGVKKYMTKIHDREIRRREKLGRRRA